MALRPTDIQIILQVSRDIERIQQLQQQYSRQQQEQLAAYMQKNIEKKKEQALPPSRVERPEIRAISSEKDKRNPSRRDFNKEKRGKDKDIHIDLLI